MNEFLKEKKNMNERSSNMKKDRINYINEWNSEIKKNWINDIEGWNSEKKIE